SPDGRVLVTGGDGGWVNGESRPPRLCRWDVATGRELPGPNPPAEVKAFGIAFRPDGRRFVTAGGPDGTVREWDPATGRPAGEPLPYRNVERLACTPDGQTLVVGCAGPPGGRSPGPLRLCAAATGQPLGRLGPAEQYEALAVSPDGRRLLAASDRTVRLWR